MRELLLILGVVRFLPLLCLKVHELEVLGSKSLCNGIERELAELRKFAVFDSPPPTLDQKEERKEKEGEKLTWRRTSTKGS